MYGFWGEGHTWPFEGNIFPNNVVAEQTWMKMLETQLKFWTKTPLVTNTEPDFSLVGNSDILDRTIRIAQLDSYGYYFYREHANRSFEQPPPMDSRGLRSRHDHG